MTPDYQGLTTALVVASLVPSLVGLGFYVWYGFALSRLFPKLGAEGWKGWVPILNEIEILVRGGVPGWSVVFYFIPVVQLYGIYLKAIAVHRINESFGRGAGFTVLGIFLPPLWATLLSGGRMPAEGDYDRRVEGLLPAPEAAQRTPDADALGAGPFVAQPAAYASAPPPPPSAPVPVSFPSLTPASEPPLFESPLFASPASEPQPPVAPEPPQPTAPPEPEPAAAPDPGTVYNPWAQGPPAAPVPPPVATPAAAPYVPEPVVAPEPVVQLAPPPVVESTAPAPAPAAPIDDDDEDDDDGDRTVVVDRRPQVPWRLVTDEGHVIPLRTRTVILGRKPTAASDGVDVIAVPDGTKTLSKDHARLELSDEGVWTVVDLNSTNGVIIIEPDGTETLLPQGGSAAIPGRFMLGKVAMRVSFDDTEATR